MRETKPASRAALAAWCLFDWANSAYPTAIITFIFGAYVTTAVAPTKEIGTAAWGYTISISALMVAALSPVVGAIADQTGPRKPWILGLSLLTIVASAGLWFVIPDPSILLVALILVGIGNFGMEFGQVFYNAMLADLVPERMVGRLSGWAWGTGYVGAIVSLAVCLFAFVQADPPPFGLDPDAAEHVRIIGPAIALWFLVFAIPMFALTPDVPSSGMPLVAAARAGLARLWSTARQLRRYSNILIFLIARMLYTDGLTTLFTFGAIYAAGTFGMNLAEVTMFGIALNVSAGIGAFALAYYDDKIGPKPVIYLSLVSLIGFGLAALLVTSKEAFWVVGIGLGAFVGPAQSASRSLMARLSPADMRAEFFGLYALSGKATAFVGPAVLAWATLAFDSQRAGMATILVFFAAGLGLLVFVKAPPRTPL
ncbi:MAG: MFS transporter [Alphaproteobacteria bacterium]|nr:MFS transporter [Alphaproteobacteria bacterium]